eukprot:172842-Pelagomonas_calceolata.AAC.6
MASLMTTVSVWRCAPSARAASSVEHRTWKCTSKARHSCKQNGSRHREASWQHRMDKGTEYGAQQHTRVTRVTFIVHQQHRTGS